MDFSGAWKRVVSRISGIGPSARILLFCSLPLAGLITGLAVEQFAPQRHALLADLTNLTAEQHYALRTMLMSSDRRLENMRLTMEQSIAQEGAGLSAANAAKLHPVIAQSPSGPIAGTEWTPAANDPSSGNLVGIPDLGQRRGQPVGPVDAGIELLTVLEMEKRVGDDSQSSYFLSAQGDFVTIYPKTSLTDFIQASSAQFTFNSVHELIARWQAEPLFQLGIPLNNPERTSYWTGIHQDAGGAGAIISHGAPVYVAGTFYGIVATDIHLSAFDAVLAHMKQPVGLLAIVDQQDAILGLNGVAFDGNTTRMREYFASHKLLDVPNAETREGGFEKIGENWVMARAVPGSDFRLIYVLPEDDLNAHLLPQFRTYALILFGLVVTLAVILFFLHRSYIRPSFDLAGYLAEQAAGTKAAAPILPRSWKPSFDKISEAFANSRDYQARLEASEARFLAAASSLIDGFAIVDPVGRLVFYNDAFARLVGQRGRSHLAIGCNLKDVLEPAWLSANAEPRLLDGRWVNYRESAMPDGGAVILLRDVTETRQSELQLRESEARLAALLAYAPVAIMLMDGDGRMVMANPEVERMLNRNLATMKGKRFSDLVSADAAIDLDASIIQVLNTGQVQVSEEHDSLREHYRDALAIRFPLHNSKGDVEGVGIFAVDLTLQKMTEDELRRQREAIYQNEKLAALGSLLAGVAHELNNPLSIVVGYAGMLEDMAPDDATRRRAREVHLAAERCARIVKRFLAMARSKPVEKKWISIDNVIDDVIELAAYGLRSNGVQVVRERATDLPLILADADHLHQVFMNLVLNAMQAMMGVEGPRLLRIGTVIRRQSIVIDVIDTGHGIDEVVKQRAFEPFFTTKPLGLGTGIGLALCSGIVQAHGGSITLDSAPDGGAHCRVILPISDAPPAHAYVESIAGSRALGGRILIVDDEPGIASFIAEALDRHGVDVTAVTSGDDARSILAEQGFDAVLTDLRMPGMGGERLLSFTTEHHPELAGRVIVMTGDALGSETTLPRDGVTVIEKPIDIHALKDILRPLLAADEPEVEPLADETHANQQIATAQ